MVTRAQVNVIFMRKAQVEQVMVYVVPVGAKG